MLFGLGAGAFVAFAMKAASYTTLWPLQLPKIDRLSSPSIVAESVDFLASTYEIPRHTVEIVGDGYDPGKRQEWAVTQAPYMMGVCRDLATRPKGGETQHDHCYAYGGPLGGAMRNVAA